MNTIAPVTAPHRAMKTTKLLGYTIPKVYFDNVKTDVKSSLTIQSVTHSHK